MVDVSVVYVNYNTEALICASVESLYRFTRGVSFEVIVVDNHSREESLNILKDRLASFERVRFVPLQENLGFGRANNAAVPFATGDYLFILNPDTLLLNDALSILKNYLEDNPAAAACGGNLFDSEMRPARSFHRLFPSVKGELNSLMLFLPERIRYGRNRFFNYAGHPIGVAAITGADLMIKKGVVQEMGLFNDKFFMYYEDMELCCRIRKGGYEIASVPEARIQHLEGRSSSNMGRKADLVFEGRKCFYDAVGRSGWYRAVCNALFFLYCCERCVLSLFQGRESYHYWSRMLSDCLGANR